MFPDIPGLEVGFPGTKTLFLITVSSSWPCWCDGLSRHDGPEVSALCVSLPERTTVSLSDAGVILMVT